MGKHFEEITIGDHTFIVNQMPVRKAMTTLHRLIQSLGPAIGALTPGTTTDEVFGAGNDIGKADITQWGKAIGALTQNLTDTEMNRLVDLLLENAIYIDRDSGKNAPLLSVLDVVFQGDLFGLMKLLAFAIKVNFGNFSHALKGARGDIREMASSSAASTSSPRNGQFGASSRSA